MWGIAQGYRVSLEGPSGTLLRWSVAKRCSYGLKAFSWTANSHTKQQALSKSKEPTGMLLLYSILTLFLRLQFAPSEWPVP
jgi:hypothetical protein